MSSVCGAASKRWMGRVQELGCIVCRKYLFVFSPAEIHHVREGDGKGGQRPRNHLEVLPLCPSHHRNGPLSIHFHKRALLAAIGANSEQQLLDEVRLTLTGAPGSDDL